MAVALVKGEAGGDPGEHEGQVAQDGEAGEDAEALDGRDAGYVGGEEGDGGGERGDQHGHARVPQRQRHPPLQPQVRLRGGTWW